MNTELARALERLFTTLIRERGRIGEELHGSLSLTERLALAIVNDKGELRLGLLAQHMATTEATASRTVETLVSAGLLERARDPDDRRAIRITATATGRALVSERRRQLARMLAAALAGMGDDDKERLLELLNCVEALLTTDRAQAAADGHSLSG